MTRRTHGMTAIPPWMKPHPRKQAATGFIYRGFTRRDSANTRVRGSTNSEIAPHARAKRDMRSPGVAVSQQDRNRRLGAACFQRKKYSFLTRSTKRAAFAVAALLSLAAPAVAAPDGAATATDAGSLAGIARQGVLGELEVWNIPGSEFNLLVGGRQGEVLIAKLISPPRNWPTDAESPIRLLDADELCAVDGAATGSHPLDFDNRDGRGIRGLPEIFRTDRRKTDPTSSEMAPGSTSAVYSNATGYSAFAEPDGFRSEASAPQIDRSIALDSIRNDAFWFSVGKRGAPTVYAIVDPDCPFCAKAMTNLKDEVELGKLQLRIVPVPVLGERSAGLIAAVLTDEEPPVAFWRHEIQMGAFGTSDLAPADFIALRPELRAAIKNNLALMSRLNIEGVPFFAFETSDGAEIHFGVPETSIFAGALSDRYDGESN